MKRSPGFTGYDGLIVAMKIGRGLIDQKDIAVSWNDLPVGVFSTERSFTYIETALSAVVVEESEKPVLLREIYHFENRDDLRRITVCFVQPGTDNPYLIVTRFSDSGSYKVETRLFAPSDDLRSLEEVLQMGGRAALGARIAEAIMQHYQAWIA